MGAVDQIENSIRNCVILSDVDAEIAAPDAQLANACQFKQGMMQELPTRRIRLV